MNADEREALRSAIDRARRARVPATLADAKAAPARCAAVALSGRSCRNYAGPDGLCAVHRLSHAAGLREHEQLPAEEERCTAVRQVRGGVVSRRDGRIVDPRP